MAVLTGPPDAVQRALWEKAVKTAGQAYAPYSGFNVGVALVAGSGAVFAGVNVESASSPAGVCAERVALGAAATAGERVVTTVAVATADRRDVAPCGVCLQALSEFGDPIIVMTIEGEPRVSLLSDLLTVPFRR